MRTLKLHPLTKPFNEDYLQVSDFHKIRYALYGNPKGNPVFFLHEVPVAEATTMTHAGSILRSIWWSLTTSADAVRANLSES